METQKGKYLWKPELKQIEESHMTKFTSFVNEKAKKSLNTWKELHTWSTEEIGQFWELLSEYTGILWQKKASTIYTPPPPKKMQGAKWFSGGKLNFAQNLLEKVDLDSPAITAYHEETLVDQRSGRELWNRVADLSARLQETGLKKGDPVAGVLTNRIETIEIMLAVTSFGGIWSSCSPDFGSKALSSRLTLLEPKAVFYSPEYTYKGKKHCCRAVISSCLKQLSSLKASIELCCDSTPPLEGSLSFDEFIDSSKLPVNPLTNLKPLPFEALSFSDPVYIMFSSGTTGQPKCIVHGVGGTLLQHAKELMLHVDLKPAEKFMFYTSCSWMMWNWMTSGLFTGASLVLYDGSPSFPTPLSYLNVAAQEGVHVLGTSPNYLAYCKKHSLSNLKRIQGFSSLKTLLTTGSPLLSSHFQWVYEEFKSNLHLASISGGTDILSCFLLGNPNLPVYAGELQVPGLGMKVEARKQAGTEETKAELVCSKPFVSMPLYFLNDPEGTRLTESYFSHFREGDEVWRHGDSIAKTENGGYVIFGRSDATLNPGGVRMGTSEFYNCLEALEEIEDALVAPFHHNSGEKIILFVSLANSQDLSPQIETKIKSEISRALTKRHLPYRIFQIPSMPVTHNGKKLEIMVRQLLNGERVNNLSSIANPEVIPLIEACGQTLLHSEAKNA